MIRIDAMWLAVEPIDMRAGPDRLLTIVVQVFGAAKAGERWPATFRSRGHSAAESISAA